MMSVSAHNYNSLQHQLLVMGHANCMNICGQRNEIQALQLQSLKNNDSDEPNPVFAKKVRQHIELNPRMKDIYLLYRTPHDAERKGVKLELYYLFNYSAYYEGEWKNGLPHGFGRVIYDDGSLYEGCFNKGIAHCNQALFIRKDSSFYRGQIRQNKANGEGQLSTPKCFYKGKFLNDVPHGKARESYSANSYFQGEFYHGVKNGNGFYRWSADEFYSGKFRQNKIEGKGRIETKQYVYEGQFRDGKKEGSGEYVDKKSKFKYTGEFRGNKPFGKGKIVFEDGAIFDGYFNNFQKRKGTLTLEDGKKIPIDTNEEPSQVMQISLIQKSSRSMSLNQKS